MHNHSPEEYHCPICIGVAGIENKHTLLKQSDLISKDKIVSVFINSFFITGNEGHLIVVPNHHYEHLYDLPDDIAHQIIATTKRMAIILRRAYGCEGITILQNNEPAGGQHAFHYHLHIFPRYKNDHLYQNMNNKQLADPILRQQYISKIKATLKDSISH